MRIQSYIKDSKVMYKESTYNIIVPYGEDYVLLYNSLSNAVCLLSTDEYEVISSLLKNLTEFETSYYDLFCQMKEDGYIVEKSFDELSYIRFQNRVKIYSNQGLHITINPTLDCNLTCWYCSTEFAKAVHSGSMSRDLVEAIKKHIYNQIIKAKIPALHLDWFGGEPLMYFKEVIEPIAEYAKQLCEQNNVKFTQHATTNAVLMEESMIKRMSELGFTSFQIPLDGNKSHHDKIKFTSDKRGTFSRVIANINMLAEVIPNVNIILRINYDKKTLYGISDVIPLLSDNSKQHIIVDFQKVWQVTCDDNDREQLAKMKQLFAENGLNSEYWAYHPHQFYRCYSDRLHHYAINYDGRIFKCTAQDYGDDKSIGQLNLDGTISIKYALLSKMLAQATFENDRCLSCKRLPICMGPCMIRNLEYRELGKPLPCMTEHSEYPFNAYVIELAQKRGLVK